jgi:hypothetical protein
MSIPRRNRIDRSTAAENAIRAAVDAVEAMGADPRLTKAVNLLTMARETVADFVDGIPESRSWVRALSGPESAMSRIKRNTDVVDRITAAPDTVRVEHKQS